MTTQSKSLTKAQKQEKAKHLLVLFEEIKSAEDDFNLACRSFANQLNVTPTLLKKAVSLHHKHKLSSEIFVLEGKASELNEISDLFASMFAEDAANQEVQK